MRRLFYKWLYRRFYKRVLKVEKHYAKIKNNMYIANECIKLQNLMNYLREELVGDKE